MKPKSPLPRVRELDDITLSQITDTEHVFAYNGHHIMITQKGEFMEIQIDGEWRGELHCTLQQAVVALLKELGELPPK